MMGPSYFFSSIIWVGIYCINFNTRNTFMIPLKTIPFLYSLLENIQTDWVTSSFLELLLIPKTEEDNRKREMISRFRDDFKNLCFQLCICLIVAPLAIKSAITQVVNGSTLVHETGGQMARSEGGQVTGLTGSLRGIKSRREGRAAVDLALWWLS